MDEITGIPNLVNRQTYETIKSIVTFENMNRLEMHYIDYCML